MQPDSVENCLTFFRAAVPLPTQKNKSTQIGCHFEEVREMIQAIIPGHSDAKHYLEQADKAIHAIAEMFKNDPTALGSVNRIDFIDAICDQMVTAIGSAYMQDMDAFGAFEEVNASNLSKFDANGKPIFDENLKVTKGPFYRKAQLAPFI